MADNEATQIDERRYLDDPETYLGPDNLARLYEIGRVIGLDFFGIDFTLTPEREIFVFEANAAMRHNFDHAGNFPYTRPHLERVSAAFEQMLKARASK